ncbi:MAG: 50S ribosomal protein L19 [Chloroflexi bacterium]|nr:50S ribosomal protein L19 [Chloroflexota bacterium]
MSKNVNWLVATEPNPNIAELHPGATVKVSYRIKEGDKERVQSLQGTVIRLRKGGAGASFTMRQVLFGVGVERTFFLNSPHIDKVEVLQQARVRRARLYYLRGLSAKASRAKLRPED